MSETPDREQEIRARADAAVTSPAREETHIVVDDSDEPEHVDDCPGCEGVPASEENDETLAPRIRWFVETFDNLAREWVPGIRLIVRHQAMARFHAACENAPTWRDGTPVQRRLVRETTSYTVERSEGGDAR